MSRLLIVSNRLPVSVKLDRGDFTITRSVGGLATGLRGPHEQSESLWIGWPGDVTRFDPGQRERLDRKLADLRCVPVHLSQAEITRYYEGFSNGVLWPLFHYSTDKVEGDAWSNWKVYASVNQRFAEAVARQYRPGDLVWIHDYHLTLVPQMLRRLIPTSRIGFFLHIPFPSSEVFRILPWRAQILEGMLGSNLIGFHTYSYLSHFSRALLHVLRVEAQAGSLHYGEVDVRLGVFPMGIDAAEFSRLAEEHDVLSEVAAIREKSGDRKLLLGVDRLDYTKGISRRMLALERLFELEPSLRRKVRLIQIVVPSRTKVRSYQQSRKELDEIVGRINGEFATVNSVPIHYLYRSVELQQLVALYRAADVMLVTPLRDGMNLVAKEFVASRPDDDGVLVLSEFAGAAAELAEALQVNPFDLDSAAQVIKIALNMPAEERQARIRALRHRVRAYDSYRWAKTFIEELKTSQDQGRPNPTSSREEINELTDRLRSAPQLLLLLDYDGTLVPFANTPDLAAPDSEVKSLLTKLSALPRICVHVLSGRTRETLQRWLGSLPIGLHGEHGFWSRMRPESSWASLNEMPLEWKAKVIGTLEEFASTTPGSLIEEKSSGFAWHYRMTDPDFGGLQAGKLVERLEREQAGLPVDILSGDKVVEIRSQGVNKGIVASSIIADHSGQVTVLAMGDDQTDEDLFAALPEGSVAIHVGPRPSRAPYRLADTRAARNFLSSLL